MSTITDIIQEKGFKLRGQSESGKIALEFDKSDISKELFRILNKNAMFRVFFQFIVKSGGLINGDFQRCEMMKKFLRRANCERCGKELDSIWECDISSKLNKTITCCCGAENKLNDSDYKKSGIKPRRNQMMHILSKFESVLTPGYVNLCCNCSFTSPAKSSDLKSRLPRCPKCNSMIEIRTDFLIKNEIKKLLAEKQGYWLEWYTYNLLGGKIPKENMLIGTKIESNGDSTDLDICFERNKNIFCIECIDRKLTEFDLKKIHILKKLATELIIITTQKLDRYDKKHLEKMQEIFKNVKVLADTNIEKISEF